MNTKDLSSYAYSGLPADERICLKPTKGGVCGTVSAPGHGSFAPALLEAKDWAAVSAAIAAWMIRYSHAEGIDTDSDMGIYDIDYDYRDIIFLPSQCLVKGNRVIGFHLDNVGCFMLDGNDEIRVDNSHGSFVDSSTYKLKAR